MEDEKKTAVIITTPNRPKERSVGTKEWTTIDELLSMIKHPILTDGVEFFVMAVSRIDDAGNRYQAYVYSDAGDPRLKQLAQALFEQVPRYLGEADDMPKETMQ